MTFTNQQQNRKEFMEQIYVSFHSKDVSGFVWFSTSFVYTPMATSIPKQLPACWPSGGRNPIRQVVSCNDCRILQTSSTVHGWKDCFFLRKGHLIASDIGHEDAKWGVINRQTSYQIKNIYPKNILYNPLHHWTFLDIRMSKLFWTQRVLFVSVLRCGPPESINLLVPNWVKKNVGCFHVWARL